MTDKKDCMTMEQAEQKMECLREVFSIVRLVDGRERSTVRMQM